MERIAMLGLGAMGARMARRLLEAGHELTVYNRSAGPAEGLVSAGARRVRTPREAAASGDIVISMLTDDDAARAVWLDPTDGAIEGMRPGAIAVETSTVTVGWIEALGDLLDARGARLVDAPVAGSRPQAEAGALVFLVGGASDDVSRLGPVFDVLGSAVHHMGPLGRGAAMKLGVNAFFALQVAGLAEVMGMLTAAGLTAELASQTLGALPITAPALAGIAGHMVAGRFAPQFPIALVAKDLRYALGSAPEMPTVAGAQLSYGRAIEAGHGEENIAAVARLYGA